MTIRKKVTTSLIALILASLIGIAVYAAISYYGKIGKTGLKNSVPYGFGKEATVIFLAGQSNAAGCSHDEYLKKTDFDLILSGHAHGGHWRFFERGIYAPHQGLLPKYTHGIHFGRFIISTGAVNNTKPIPRFFNAPEILKITIQHKEMP